MPLEAPFQLACLHLPTRHAKGTPSMSPIHVLEKKTLSSCLVFYKKHLLDVGRTLPHIKHYQNVKPSMPRNHFWKAQELSCDKMFRGKMREPCDSWFEESLDWLCQGFICWIQWFKDVYVYIYISICIYIYFNIYIYIYISTYIYIYIYIIYIHIHNSHYWNPPISGWWLSPTSVKNMKVSWDDCSQLNGKKCSKPPTIYIYIYMTVICVNPPYPPSTIESIEFYIYIYIMIYLARSCINLKSPLARHHWNPPPASM